MCQARASVFVCMCVLLWTIDSMDIMFLFVVVVVALGVGWWPDFFFRFMNFHLK